MLDFDGEALFNLLLLLFTLLLILINLDHIHVLLDIHPDNNISQLVASLKSASSRIIRKEFAEYLDQFYHKPAFWSGLYYVASCGGVTIERLRKYIEDAECARSQAPELNSGACEP